MKPNKTIFQETIITLAAILLATLIVLFLPFLRGEGMYFLYLTAIVCCSLYGSFRAGIAATIISVALCFFFANQFGPTANRLMEWLVLIAFALASSLTVFLCYAQKSSELARQAAENKYRAIFEDAITGIYETTLDGRYANVNPQLAEMFGYATAGDLLAEAENLNRKFYVEPRRREEFIRLVAENGSLAAFESEIFRRDGSKIWISENAVAVRDAQGQIIGFQGTTIDITIRKQAEASLEKAREELEEKVIERTSDLERANAELRAEINERMRVEKELRHSEEKFRALVEMSSEMIWEVNENTDYTYISPRSCEFNGYAPEEILGNKPFMLMPPEEAQRVAKIFKRIGEKQETFYFLETTTVHKDGKISISETSGVPFFDEAGNFRGYRGVARDVTERKRIENELRQSEEKFRAIVETSPDWFWETDEKAIFTYLSPRVKDVLGYEPEELIGKNCYDLMPPGDAEKLIKTLKPIVDERKIISAVEYIMLRKNGETVALEANAVPFYDGDGNYQGYRGIARDVTERKRADEALRESREMLQLVINTIPLGVFWKDRDGRFLGCNAYVARRAGFDSPDEIIGLTDYEMPWTREESDFYRKCDRRVMDSGAAELGIVETLRQADDRQIWLETNKVPLKDSTGATVGILGTFLDITEKKRADAALRESQLHLSSVVTAAPVILYALDRRGVFTLSEGKGLDALNLLPGEVVGRSIFEMYEDAPQIASDVNRALGGANFTSNTKIGDLCYESRYTPIFDEAGAVAGLIGVSIDVTENKKNEDELRASRQRLRDLSAHLQNLREDERKKLARELHDELGQQLTALKIELVRLGGKLSSRARKNAANGAEGINAMLDIVDLAMETTRKIVAELRPGVLDELGLAAAMEWQVNEFIKRTGIICELHIEFNEAAACQNLKTTVFRILQECLTNVARHSGATKACITLMDEGWRIFFEIEDDGRGFGEKLEGKTNGNAHSFGLLGIRERAFILNGSVETGAGALGGARVTVSIPRPSVVESEDRGL